MSPTQTLHSPPAPPRWPWSSAGSRSHFTNRLAGILLKLHTLTGHQVQAWGWGAHPLLLMHKPCGHCVISRLQYAVGQNPFKPAPQTWLCANSSQKGQHHTKVTPSLEYNHIHQSDCCPSNRLGANSCSDCRAHPPTKTWQGITHRDGLQFGAAVCLANAWSD